MKETNTNSKNIYYLLSAICVLLLFLAAFFLLVIEDNNKGALQSQKENTAVIAEDSYNIPILLYHHIAKEDTEGDPATISQKNFKKHMDMISDAGYNTVSLDEICSYVYNGTALPDNPILLTFDDGYYSNYEIAYPTLREKGMKAAIFMIGWAVGEDTYKNTGSKIIPHFTYEEAREMENSGVIEIQSHTYDMHASLSIEGFGARLTATPLKDETEEEFKKAFYDDFYKFDQNLIKNLAQRTIAFSYPHGVSCSEAEDVLKENGVKMTFTTDATGKNIISEGDTDSLYKMYRITVSGDISADELLKEINKIYK